MKKIEAFIRPEKMTDINECLTSKQINGMSIIQAMGFGKQKGWKEFVRGSEMESNLQPKIKIELFALDSKVDEIVECITKQAHTGEVGDGKIFISDIDTAIRIRTNEHGDDVLK